MMSRILAAANGTEYFAASWIAVWLVERSGRRPLMLFGAAGQCLTMVVLAIVNAPSITKPEYKPEIDDVGGTNTAASVIATVCLFLFNTFFAIGWLGMTWLTPAEMTPLVVRAACNGISTASNWLFNFISTSEVPLSTISFCGCVTDFLWVNSRHGYAYQLQPDRLPYVYGVRLHKRLHLYLYLLHLP